MHVIDKINPALLRIITMREHVIRMKSLSSLSPEKLVKADQRPTTDLSKNETAVLVLPLIMCKRFSR